MSLKTFTLGRTGIQVSELCLGTLTMSALQLDLSPEATVPIFEAALDAGITFFDTAVAYRTHGHVRRGLGRRTHEVVIATKLSAKTAEDGRRQLDGAFADLGRDFIDICLLHNVSGEEDLSNRRPVLDLVLAEKARGRVGAVGFSCHAVAGVRAAVAHSDVIEVVHPILNRRGLGIQGGTLDDQLAAVRAARARGIGVYAMKPMGGGHLRREARAAIDFVRGLECVDAVAVGMKSPDEVRLNAALFSDGAVPVDEARLAEIASADRRVFVNFMCRRCGQCVKTCDQQAMRLGERKAEADPEKCILCGYCAEHCPVFAIRVI